MLRRVVPVFHVANSRTSQQFYGERLGFRVEFANRPGPDDDPCFMDLVRDEVRLSLSSFRDDGVPGSLITIFVADLDALHAEFVRNGAPIDLPPFDQTWGQREMFVRDPDRNKIVFAQSQQPP